MSMEKNSYYHKLFTQRINELLNEGKTLRQVANESSISTPALSRYLKGESTPSLNKLDKMEKALSLEPGWFLESSDITRKKNSERHIPLFDRLPETIDLLDDDATDYISVPGITTAKEDIVGCRIKADTMAQTIEPGDIVLLEPVDEKHKSIQGVYCIQYGRGVTLGRPMPSSDKTTVIVYDNSNYPSLEIPTNKCNLIWRVMLSIRQF